MKANMKDKYKRKQTGVRACVRVIRDTGMFWGGRDQGRCVCCTGAEAAVLPRPLPRCISLSGRGEERTGDSERTSVEVIERRQSGAGVQHGELGERISLVSSPRLRPRCASPTQR